MIISFLDIYCLPYVKCLSFYFWSLIKSEINLCTLAVAKVPMLYVGFCSYIYGIYILMQDAKSPHTQMTKLPNRCVSVVTKSRSSDMHSTICQFALINIIYMSRILNKAYLGQCRNINDLLAQICFFR